MKTVYRYSNQSSPHVPVYSQPTYIEHLAITNIPSTTSFITFPIQKHVLIPLDHLPVYKQQWPVGYLQRPFNHALLFSPFQSFRLWCYPFHSFSHL